MPSSRRRLLQSAAGLASAGVVAQSAPAQPLLPTVKLGKYDVTRLVVGANPFYGYSHFNRIYDQVMQEWSTPENVCATLRKCEANGINTWQFSYNERSVSDYRRHLDEGGKLQWVLLSSSILHTDPAVLRKAAAGKPIGIVHHGGITDRLARDRKFEEIRTFLKRVRDTGVLAGMSAHNPDNIARAEEEGWETDFYMTCCYYVTRPPEEIRKIAGDLPLGEVFLEGDPARMFQVVRKTRKTCLAFKILAAGRRIRNPAEIDRAFSNAFDSIKPQDGVIVGMWPKFSDEVTDNANRVRKLLGARS